MPESNFCRILLDCGSWKSGAGTGSSIIHAGDAAGTAFVVPLNGWGNSEIAITNTSSSPIGVRVEIYDENGTHIESLPQSIPGNGCRVIGNIYDYAKPAIVKLGSVDDIVVQSRRWSSSSGWGAFHLPTAKSAGRGFMFPAGGWSNCWFDIANTDGSATNITIKVYDKNGVLRKNVTSTVAGGALVSTWDIIGDIYDYANPAMVSIESDKDIVVGSGRFSSSSGWGFSVPTVDNCKGNYFAFPIKGWGNSFSNIANTSYFPASVTVNVYSSEHNLEKTRSATIAGHGVLNTWKLMGDLYGYGYFASPKMVEIISDRNVVVDNGRWSSGSGWGFTVQPSSVDNSPVPALEFTYATGVKGFSDSRSSIVNVSSSNAYGLVRVYNGDGAIMTEAPFSLAPKAQTSTWSLLGDIYDYANPAVVRISSTEPLYVNNSRWSSNSGWGYDVPEVGVAAGREFVVPLQGWINSWVNITNPYNTSAQCAVMVYDAAGEMDSLVVANVPPFGIISTWDLLGNIYSLADPAVVKVTSNADVLVEHGSWKSGAGWGSISLPVATSAGKSFLFPPAYGNNSWMNIANTEDSSGTVTVTVIGYGGEQKVSRDMTIEGNGFVNTWDWIGNIRDYIGASVSIESNKEVTVTSASWSSYGSAEFNVPKKSDCAGKRFVFAFASLYGNSCRISNVSATDANVNVRRYNTSGVLTGDVTNGIAGNGGTSFGFPYSDSRATIEIISDQDIILYTESYFGIYNIGFTILPLD